MTSRQSGFTLIEIVVVLAVMGVLLGSAVPLLGSALNAGRRHKVGSNLRQIATALEEFYFDNGSFPASLDATGFFGNYLQSGINGDAIEDAWGGGVPYVYGRTTSPDTANVHSRGENDQDDGHANEDYKISISGTAPGLRRTRQRMRVIVEVLAGHLEGGGTLSGAWSADRATLGLGSEFQTDGFGTGFSLDAASMVLRSAGPDRILNTSDDLTT